MFCCRNVIGGLIMVLIGVAFLLANYGLLFYDFWKLWPLILIAIGAGMLMRDDRKKFGKRRSHAILYRRR